MSKLDDAIEIKTLDMYNAKLSDPCYNSDLEMKTINYDPTGMPNSQRAYTQAAVEGLDVVLPKDNELFIDIDNKHSYMLYNNLMGIIQKFIGVADVVEEKSKSGKEWNMHITVLLDQDVTPIERLALQAMLGSDRVRELLGYIQLKNGDPAPTLFLEKKAPAQLTEGR